MVEINCHIFIKRKIKFFIQILFVFTYFISINTLYKISSHNIYNNIYITQNRILTESHNNKNKSLRTSYINEYTTVDETEYDNDIDDVETNCQLQDNVSTENDNLETLLEEYHEEMKEINETNKKSFFKRGLYLIDCLDNIFIDKLVDQNIKNKTSSIVEHVIALSVFLFPCCAIFSQIPIHTYIIKRFDFLERY
ncbi:Plasmodium exported protein (hyp6), unknown function [Plasmodium sp. gorilla clade G2]|uniref:Plasmodium exported protein (hyp6), unknown function n=1 Tax=Plasmodium sp. gorilla clade G2 TaxID=880535 RepID=UPI000D21CEC8|nr:Plasmodium exported protein (hyp6), unknown function [Plasmodium sp. gorilla clade G2]SOV19986.1 Plasmodium exported protein (hyp6), unknown function [Plasmodium sp. gorilla clade G2]